MAYVAEISDRLQVLAHGRPGHIIDRLIAERGGRLVNHPAWPVMRPFLYATLKYGAAVKMADSMAQMSGHGAFAHLSDLLKLDIQTRREERIPEKGGFLLVANHPTGMADGVAMFDFLSRRRPDMMIFANRDAVRVNPRLNEIIIPVEWRDDYKSRDKTRETLQLTNRAVQEGKATVLFPSGRIAFWNESRLTERPWKVSAVTLARRHDLPVIPVNISARNSGLFYWLSKHSTELRDMTVFHELLNKKHHTFRFTVGKPILPDALDGDPAEAVKALEYHTVHGLAKDPDRAFEPAPEGWAQAV